MSQRPEIKVQDVLPPSSTFREAMAEDLELIGSLTDNDHEQMGFGILMKERRLAWKKK